MVVLGVCTFSFEVHLAASWTIFARVRLLFFSSLLLSSLELSDTHVYESYMRALLGTASVRLLLKVD